VEQYESYRSTSVTCEIAPSVMQVDDLYMTRSEMSVQYTTHFGSAMDKAFDL